MKRTIRVIWSTVCTLAVASALLLTCLGWWSIHVYGQDTTYGEASMLPPLRGDALTLTPNDLPDISCSVVQWKDDPTMPSLAVICPPKSVFAPLHVYLALSWLKPEDVPPSARGITVLEKTVVKIRTNKSTAWVRLGVRKKHGVALRMTWMPFNGVTDMALLALPGKR